MYHPRRLVLYLYYLPENELIVLLLFLTPHVIYVAPYFRRRRLFTT